MRRVIVATHAAVKHMKDWGRIINIGRQYERQPYPLRGGAIYAMSKSALQGLMRALARHLGPRGITINNLQPRGA